MGAEGGEHSRPHGHDQLLETAQQTLSDVGSSVRVQAGTLLVQRGESERGRAIGLEGIDLARRIASPYSEANALNQYTWLLVHDRDPQAAAHWAQQLVAQSNERGYLFLALLGSFLLAWAEASCIPASAAEDEASRQSLEDAIGRMRQSFELARAADAAMGTSGWIGAMVEVYLQHGRVDEAQDLIEQARVHIEATGEDLYLAEHLRLRGEVAIAVEGAKPQEAEPFFDQAIQVARRQGTRTYELRAASQLARLWADQGERDRARELLADCRAQFGEDASSSAVKEAEGLLAALF
ncbi:MAG: hypothetical protein CL910_01660 [Deltaproteobacteria bacterium]|nr:hypothetical protein [Deltaproteobacteria bacterium]